MSKQVIAIVLMFFIHPLWAYDDYWQCTAFDGAKHQWVIKNAYERVAENKALEACKKQSPVPSTCKIIKNNCDYFANGLSTKPFWQCTALDQMSKLWLSDFFNNRDEAAMNAKALCQKESGMPDTCYVNLLTCKNLNEHP